MQRQWDSYPVCGLTNFICFQYPSFLKAKRGRDGRGGETTWMRNMMWSFWAPDSQWVVKLRFVCTETHRIDSVSFPKDGFSQTRGPLSSILAKEWKPLASRRACHIRNLSQEMRFGNKPHQLICLYTTRSKSFLDRELFAFQSHSRLSVVLHPAASFRRNPTVCHGPLCIGRPPPCAWRRPELRFIKWQSFSLLPLSPHFPFTHHTLCGRSALSVLFSQLFADTEADILVVW